MTKADAYCWIVHNADRHVAWIAGVFLTAGGPHAAKTIKALVALIRSGHEIGSLSFTMPYDRLLLDGAAVTPAELREAAARLYAERSKP